MGCLGVEGFGKIGQRGRSCTCVRPVPDGGCYCYTTRCLPRRDSVGRRGLGFFWKQAAPSLDGGPR